MDGTLQRKTHKRFASLCVSIKAIPTASTKTRREVFLCSRFVSPVKRRNGRKARPHVAANTERGLALFLRSEIKPGRKEKQIMFCSKCGELLADYAIFCPKCGNKVTETVDKAGSETAFANTRSQESEPPVACSDKSRRTYQCLALFLGAVGAHNFYAGRVKIAIAQLCLTLFQAVMCEIRGKNFFAIAAIWAIVEIFTVKKDGKGLPFAAKTQEKKGEDGKVKKNFGGCLAICALILLVGSCLSHLGSDEDDKGDLSQTAKTEQNGDGIPYCKDVSDDGIAKACFGGYMLTPEKDVLYKYYSDTLVVRQVVKKEDGVGYYLCGLRDHGFGHDLGEDREILVVSAADYADGDVLKSFCGGEYCLCKGTWTYETVLGGSKTVYVFVMIKDNELAEKIIKDVENRKKEQRRLDEISRQLKEGADDGTDARISEICGFKFGATPLKGVSRGKYGSQTLEIDSTGKLPPFAQAELCYTKKDRLHSVILRSPPAPKRTIDEQKRLMLETKQMLERKFGIVLKDGVENLYGLTGYFGTVSKGGAVLNEFELLSTTEHVISFSVKDREVVEKDNY